jgi:hypothetical protein
VFRASAKITSIAFWKRTGVRSTDRHDSALTS